ncbi:MAG: mannan chain length control protein LmeA [Mycobacterium sp.]|nr:mannan chain length control protein LmeA [Mycobacterium sp.]
MRKVLTRLLVSAAALILVAVGTDFGFAIFAEYRMARSVRTTAHLHFDPWVSILGFPFAPQAARGRYQQVEVKAAGVSHPVAGKVSLEATLYDMVATPQSWLIGPDVTLSAARLESRIIVDSTHVGRFMGIKDLLVEAPPNDTNNATGGTTESGISESHGLVFTGTPTAAGLDERVSVSVDLSISGADHTNLVFTATEVLTGPGTAEQSVPDDKKAAVLRTFSTTMPGMKLPFGLTPTSEGARGSDVIIEGIATGVTKPLDGFRQS